MAHIHSVISEVPPYTLTQMEFYDFVAPNIKPRLQNIFKRILSGSQIRKRHFCTSINKMIEMTEKKQVEDKFKIWKDSTMEFWTNQGKELLRTSGLEPHEIDGICTATTSGFVTPDPTILIPHALKMRSDIIRMPLLGFGCSGGLAAINRVSEYLKAFPEKAFLVCVGEALSTQYEKAETASVLVSNSIFGDGFASLLMVGKEHKLAAKSQIELLNSNSHIFPNCDFAIGQWMTDEGLHTHVDAKIPQLIHQGVREPIENMFETVQSSISDIDYWICHAGGPKVMEAFGESLELPDSALDVALETYRNYGNQSSVSVLNALETTLTNNSASGLGFLMALGPGVHMEYSLCKVTPHHNKKSLKNSKRISSKLNNHRKIPLAVQNV